MQNRNGQMHKFLCLATLCNFLLASEASRHCALVHVGTVGTACEQDNSAFSVNIARTDLLLQLTTFTINADWTCT